MGVLRTDRLVLREFRDSDVAPLYEIQGNRDHMRFRPENQASIRVLEKCGFTFVRYEPALERNHYQVRQQDWGAQR
jgi:RimJ/RimL family protein N-acetyltransferase